jgi:hypothetical protein
VGSAAGLPKVREVRLGWAGIERTTIPEATLWVSPDRSVIEAWVWPPVAASGSVRVRSAAGAWLDVRSHAAPLVVLGSAAGPGKALKGRLTDVHTVLILVPGRSGAAYLLPAYRFAGTGLVDTRQKSWLSLVPGR